MSAGPGVQTPDLGKQHCSLGANVTSGKSPALSSPLPWVCCEVGTALPPYMGPQQMDKASVPGGSWGGADMDGWEDGGA